MKENYITAIIALSGIFISVLSSLFISMRQARIESQKLRNEYLHRYAGKLFDKRIEAYPKIVEHLVVFFQKVNAGKIKAEDVKSLLPILLIWDAENSTLLSAESQHSIHNTTRKLIELDYIDDQELNELILNKDWVRQFRDQIFEFYLALKNDLGIYSFKPPSEISQFNSPRSVKELGKLNRK